MNVTVLHHEYKGGCILTFSLEGGGNFFFGGGEGDITYLFASPLFEAYVGSR